jgi:hypothetical protein
MNNIKINFTERDVCKKWTKRIPEYGFGIEIKLHSIGSEYSPQGTWCSYLFFCDKMFYLGEVTKTKMLDFLWENVDNNGGILSELPWHSGVTLVEKVITENGQRRILIGDDYAHAWDDGIDYSLEEITHNITNVAEKCYGLLKRKGVIEESKNE